MEHLRYIFPVGQGGFAAEQIEDFTVVYDCGTVTSTPMIESCIDFLSHLVSHINVLFISHFDKDHVNSLRYLLGHIKVQKAVTSFIPKDLRTVFGIYTNGAYTDIMALLNGNRVEEIEEIEGGEDDNNGRKYAYRTVWEWIAKSMMTGGDFATVMNELFVLGIDMTRLDDAGYLEQEKVKVNNAFKKAFGNKGPNAKGLVMLSQKCKGVDIDRVRVGQGFHWSDYLAWSEECDVSSCFYVGDVDICSKNKNDVLKAFLNNRKSENVLLFMQIPHHGSKSNVRTCFENDYPAMYYFVNDKDTKRIQKNTILYSSLAKRRRLLVSRALPQDLIVSETIVG